MRPLTPQEKRTIRLGAIVLAIGVVFSVGLRAWRFLEGKRAEHQKLVVEAQRLKRELRPYENQVLLTEKLKEQFRLDPKKLSRASLVAEVSSAIQKAAGNVQVQFGHVRESAGRSTGKELASMQLEGLGPVPAVMSLLHRLDTIGYPVVVDSLQISGDATKPGMVKVSLTIVILDFDQWKAEPPNA